MASPTTTDKINQQYADKPELRDRALSFLSQNPSATNNDVQLFLSVPADFKPTYYYSSKTKLYYVTREDGTFATVNSAGTFKGSETLQNMQISFGSDLGKLSKVAPEAVDSQVQSTANKEAYNISSLYHFQQDSTPRPSSGTSSTPSGNLGGGTSTTSTGANAGRTAVTLGNGQTVYYDTSGKAYNDAGTLVSPDVVAHATSSSTPVPELASTNTGQSAQSQAALQAILNNPSLSADQKAVIQSIYGAVSSNDADTAAKIKTAMEAATKYSDPYFKAQVQLATDALSRGLNAKDGDLAYQETSLRNALDKLTKDTSASKDQLSFEHAQELKQLEQKYTTDLEDTRTNLAATGFTDSSRRAQSEKILNDTNQGLVESSNKTYGYQTGNLDRSLNYGQQNTQAQIANLQRLASEGKLDLLRTAESQVGSKTLGDLGYSGLLGNVGGSIPRQQAQDSLSFASNFVF